MEEISIPFEAWDFTPEEFGVAASFSLEQTRHIQTELAAYASQKVALAFDPSSGENAQLKYILEQEYLRGCCEALTSLLNTSDEAKSDLLAFIEKQKESQTEKHQPKK